MKFLLIFLVLFLTACTSLSLPKKIEQSTVSIRSSRGGGGTGVIIKSNSKYTLVLTNRHVCEGMGIEPFVLKINKNDYAGQIVHVSEKADLCLVLMRNAYNFPSVTISKNPATPLEEVYTLGNPLNRTNVLVKGFASVEEVYENSLIQNLSLTVYAGQSGSGVFNSSGELVGLIFASIPIAPTLSVMVSLSEIKEFLEEIK